MVGRATELLQHGRLAEAEAIYRQVLQRRPDQLGARHMLGVLRIRGGRYDEACQELRAVLDARPDAAEAWSHLALALHALNLHLQNCAVIAEAHRVPGAIWSLGKTLIENAARSRAAG